jgi:hypothetical protein
MLLSPGLDALALCAYNGRMSRIVSTLLNGAVVCRLFNSHKWVRIQTPTEEAYQCRRCGKRHFGKVDQDPDLTPFAGGG